MDTSYCSKCLNKRSPSFFLRDASSSPSSRVFATCYICRKKDSLYQTKRKRPALQEIDPNIGPLPAQRLATSISRVPSGPFPNNHSPIPPVQRPTSPVQLLQPAPVQPTPVRPTLLQPAPVGPTPAQPTPIRPPPPRQPAPVGPTPAQPTPVEPLLPDSFLPAEQWQRIRNFQTYMSSIEMETCTRCKARWFDMKLKAGICHTCAMKDKGRQTVHLLSAENNMDPGIVPAHLPALTQVEEMVIARSHVQMMIKRYRGHQYHYTSHCVSFTQEIVKTVNILPNLLEELDIILLRPSRDALDNT